MAAAAPTMQAPGSAGNPPYPQVPVIDKTMSIVVLLVNVFVPGIGTLIGGVLGNRGLIGRGIAQPLLSIIVVGWIWAIVSGVQFLQNATWAERNGVRPA